MVQIKIYGIDEQLNRMKVILSNFFGEFDMFNEVVKNIKVEQ